jgi:protein SCO1/2
MLSKSIIPYLKKTFKNPFVIAFLIGIASLHLVKEMALARRSAPPPLVMVGPWSLINHEDHKFGSEELKGKVVIANFFFTRCPTICPKLISNMNEVHQRFEKEADDVHFVSFSVDPDFDTPKVLRDYQEKMMIAAPNWTFLTGTTEQMVNVVTNQMKFHMGEKDELLDISHVAELLLFDQNGDLRGKFPTDTTGLAAIVRSAKFLLEKGPRG